MPRGRLRAGRSEPRLGPFLGSTLDQHAVLASPSAIGASGQAVESVFGNSSLWHDAHHGQASGSVSEAALMRAHRYGLLSPVAMCPGRSSPECVSCARAQPGRHASRGRPLDPQAPSDYRFAHERSSPAVRAGPSQCDRCRTMTGGVGLVGDDLDSRLDRAVAVGLVLDG